MKIDKLYYPIISYVLGCAVTIVIILIANSQEYNSSDVGAIIQFRRNDLRWFPFIALPPIFGAWIGSWLNKR